ncbi:MULTISPECIES: hypothetical protein [Sulfolobaceae]|uniref:hypothetical protein n=1 Tax=Sulfolobaceae TaxID=118883 RepID=UPI001180B080|nr:MULTISPECIES: hypothetical protein [unclassified Sulfolobus]TRM87598.1 hypothetical protein DJ529_07945 [Sulfolobus sp. C3]TRN03502.1 hypothetical protein DJ527_01760 [Sulfolobus sp. F1]
MMAKFEEASPFRTGRMSAIGKFNSRKAFYSKNNIRKLGSGGSAEGCSSRLCVSAVHHSPPLPILLLKEPI